MRKEGGSPIYLGKIPTFHLDSCVFDLLLLQLRSFPENTLELIFSENQLLFFFDHAVNG